MNSTSTGDSVWRIDQSRAHSSRVLDMMLGGKDNYEPDHKLGHALQVECPKFTRVVADARAFSLRASRYAATADEAGVRQFLELGCGYPRTPNLHEVVTAAVADARTVYVDNDPIVVAHQRVMLRKDPNARIVWADFTQTDRIMDELESILNLDEPVAVSLSFALELVEHPSAVVNGLVGSLAAGSLIVISHLSSDADLAVRAAEIFGMHGIHVRPRSYADVVKLMANCDLVDPGIVAPRDWRPHVGAERRSTGTSSPSCYALVGRVS